MTGAPLATDPAGAAPRLALASGLRPITPREFKLFRDTVYREAGIRLAPCKEALVVGRLSRRLRELGVRTFGEYHARVEEDPAERTRMLEALCTHETHFFREPRHWELLERDVLPRWRAEGNAGRREKRVRAWSAACSSGEEAYTLAMVLRHHLPPEEGWMVEVTATDLSTRVLERAKEALWPVEKAREVPAPYLKRWMLRGTRSQEGKMTVAPELRELVRFARVNLNDASYPVPGRFDLVFCRNVLIYFDRDSRAPVVDRLLDRVSPGGLFFLGHAESLNGVTTRAKVVIPTVYTLVNSPKS